jgi:molecular chaperone HscB
MICWSCERDAADAMTCPHCGALQPPDGRADHFQVLGVEPRFGLDVADLERRYKELTKVLHPDRFARADERARRASLQRSIQLNEAWRTLKEPVRRAEYLLSLAGFEVGGEDGTSRSDGEGNRERLPVAAGLLMEVMELREGLAEARASKDHARVAALATEVRDRREGALEDVATEFEAPSRALESIAGHLVAIRYYDRFLEEVAVHDEATAESGHGG